MTDAEKRKRSWTVFKEYYLKVVILVAVIVALVVGITIADARRPDEAFMIISVDVAPAANIENYLNEFLVSQGIDTEKNTATFRPFFLDEVNQETINSIQSIVAFLTARQLDFGVMDRSSFATYGYMGMYTDLRTFLTEDQMAQLEGHLFYIDREDLEKAEGLPIEEPENEEDLAKTPDPNLFGGKEGMVDPVPVGVNLCSFPQTEALFANVDNESFAGVVANSERIELAQNFMRYLLFRE